MAGAGYRESYGLEPVGTGSGTILRFRKSERLLHWSIAIPFMLCYASAVILLLVYNPAPQRPFREVFSWIHRLSGVGLIVFPPLVLLGNWSDYKIHLTNIKEGWIWTLNDIRWLGLMGLAAVSKRFRLPEQGKFNAAEKINFMMVMSTYPLFILTGVLIWLPGVAFFSWLLHVFMAAVVTPLMLGHIFMATINPGSRVGLSGMITGFVDRQWAKHHYTRWYRENFEHGRPAPASRPVDRPEPLGADRAAARPAVAASSRPGQVAVLRCPSCNAEHAAVPWDRLVDSVFAVEPSACARCGADGGVASVSVPLHELESILSQLERGAIGGASPTPQPASDHRPRTIPLSATGSRTPLPGAAGRRGPVPGAIPLSRVSP